jgi:phosphoglycerate kinase
MTDIVKGLRRVQDAAVEGKSVLVRVDYNVPLSGGAVADDARITASFPTLEHLLNHRAKVVLVSHLGDPEGQVVPGLRLDPIAERLEALLGRPVKKLRDCVGDEVKDAVAKGVPADLFLLENVRFHPGESTNDPQFAHKLSELADLYVNDAFAALHRAHASTEGVTHFLPSYAGLLVQKEIAALSRLTNRPERPYIALIGGKKAESKLGALRDLLGRVDTILIGGGVAFTFLHATGCAVGASVVDESVEKEIREVIRLAGEKKTRIVLPTDVVIARAVSAIAETATASAKAIPEGWIGLDIGPETVEIFRQEINRARTIVWTGPMGAFELEPFSNGTRAIASALARARAFTVVGGGETGEAVATMGQEKGISYISTGGGACLAILRGKTLPALEALRDSGSSGT